MAWLIAVNPNGIITPVPLGSMERFSFLQLIVFVLRPTALMFVLPALIKLVYSRSRQLFSVRKLW